MMMLVKARATIIERVSLLRLEVALGLTALTVPFVLGGPQWLVGTIVNTVLFLAALRLERRNWWPVIVLPSLGVAARGLIFGPLTLFLIYFIPFIWAGNWILMRTYAGLGSWPRVVRVTAAALTKAAWLYGAAMIYFKLGIVPGMFLGAMGVVQLMTSLAGGVVALIL